MAFGLRCSISLLSAFLLLFASPVIAQRMVSVSGDEVTLRSGPGTQHPAQWVVDRGFPLKVVGRRGSWLEVRDFENDGSWINRSLTSSTPYHIVNVKGANMRSQPTTRSRIIAKLLYGEVLRTLKREKGWVRVQRESGLRGWISQRLVWGW